MNTPPPGDTHPTPLADIDDRLAELTGPSYGERALLLRERARAAPCPAGGQP